MKPTREGLMRKRTSCRTLPTSDKVRQQGEERHAKGYHTLEEVAECLRAQLDWSEAQHETFLHESLIPAALAGRLPVLHPDTLAPYQPETPRTLYELTTPTLVNGWLQSQGLPFRWGESVPDAPMSAEDEALAERIHNGGPVDWLALAHYTNLTPMQAAQATHRIDPFKWPDPERYAQGSLAPDLWERIQRLEQLLRGKAAEWSLVSLVEVLGEQAPLEMRQAAESMASVLGSSRQLKAGGTAETPEERRDRLAKRKRELKSQRHPSPTKQVAEEEGITEARVRQILGKKSQPTPAQTAANPFGLGHKR